MYSRGVSYCRTNQEARKGTISDRNIDVYPPKYLHCCIACLRTALLISWLKGGWKKQKSNTTYHEVSQGTCSYIRISHQLQEMVFSVHQMREKVHCPTLNRWFLWSNDHNGAGYVVVEIIKMYPSTTGGFSAAIGYVAPSP